MKADTVYKRAHNQMLDLMAALEPGTRLPSETELGQRLGVSRTTVRKVIDVLSELGAVEGSGRTRVVGSMVVGVERFPDAQTLPVPEQLEERFMRWTLRDDARPGTVINEAELAREFGVATISIREFLNHFMRFGLIERRPYGGWVFRGFTRAFALELFEIREMFELRSALAFGRLPVDAPVWAGLECLRRRHVELLSDIDRRFHDFATLDSAFHRYVNAAVPNRFINGFNDINALIFHYHYQWNKKDERRRNEAAIGEHLTYIDALVTRDSRIIEHACRAHLTSALDTLLRSTER